ncbi:MAG TPA: glycosyltransferase family 9 protein [Patescibacteria group bacterium]|nr:glycosyltransferase family 9 protein [Patescibacteria group bacterium]
MSIGIREHFSKEGRKLCEDNLGWDTICAKWDKVIGEVNISKNNPYPKLNIPKPTNLEDLLEKEKKDRFLYVMPGTYGDVFLSTAVIDGIKKKYPDKDIYFATGGQYIQILEGNPNIHKILPYDGVFNNIPLMNNLFDIVFTPAVATQASNNWTRNGHGEHLARTYATHCGVELGNLYMRIIESQDALEGDYLVVHTKTGQEAKNYSEYQKIINQIDIPVVQVGSKDDQLLKNVIDKRSKNIQETASIIKKAKLFLGGDSICAHIAGYVGIPSVLLYGSTFSALTKPLYKDQSKLNVIEPANRYSCERPCHLAKCNRSPNPCINNIDAKMVVEHIGTLGILTKAPVPPTLSGYTTTLNPEKYYPWRQSIKSLLGVCDEVVVVDGGSTDGTLEALQEWKKTEPKLKVFKRKWRMDEPAMDGMMKSYARALCTKEFCWQQDCDELIHESDYSKLKDLLINFPSQAKVLTLPVIHLYGTTKTILTDKGLYKARLSKNLPEITHGIPKQLRQTTPQGKLFCDKDRSDGCDYINSQTFDHADGQISFINAELMQAQQTNMPKFKSMMVSAFKQFPSVWHFSWHDLVRRINVDLEFWDGQWNRLNTGQTIPPNRFFPNTKREDVTPELIKQRADFLKDKTLEEKPMDLIQLNWLDTPEVIKSWLSK